MDSLTYHLSAWDGLKLHAQEWNGGEARLPLLCLPGLVRNSGDFADLAAQLGAGRRVVAVDYAGRGRSGRAGDPARYGPEACLRDVMDVCAALDLAHVVAIGTSFGGLLAMGLAVARPMLLRGVVLNDVGPEIGRGGAEFVRGFIGHDPALPDLDACAAFLREHLPPLSLRGEAEWRRMAALTYERGPDGHYHPRWDLRIARLLEAPARDLWPFFGALGNLPLLLVRGGASDILRPDTAARMRAERPDMGFVDLPGIGHAPTLAEPAALAALRAFLEAAG